MSQANNDTVTTKRAETGLLGDYISGRTYAIWHQTNEILFQKNIIPGIRKIFDIVRHGYQVWFPQPSVQPLKNIGYYQDQTMHLQMAAEVEYEIDYSGHQNILSAK